ncbi:abortive infection family protein [Sorangium sp. So ce124]|uniref:abortive infection family protein n=1 Tax=Sorangium sp. So ce124 TaxID=3133280 RepID=UPI003F606643
MIVLAHGSGAQDFYTLDRALPPELWQRVRITALQLLRKRGQTEAADALESIPFELLNATNGFNDEFAVLQATLNLDEYVNLSASKADSYSTSTYNQVKGVFSELGYYVRFIAAELATSTAPVVAPPVLAVSSQAVERSLRDADNLTTASGASSAVDRVHTAFHGYLLAACSHSSIPVPANPSITQLFKLLRTQHPSFTTGSSVSPESIRIVNSLANIVDALNPIRNNATLAHPNPALLSEPEAMLVINTVRTLFHYLNALIV